MDRDTHRAAAPDAAGPPVPPVPPVLAETRAPVPHAMVGTGVIVTDSLGRLLLGRSVRGGWELPGGKLDPGESFEVTAVRELAEETGLRADPEGVRVLSLLVDTAGDVPRLTVAVRVRQVTGEPSVTEPHAVTAWTWHDPASLPGPLFAPTAQVLAAWRPGLLADLPPVHRYGVAVEQG